MEAKLGHSKDPEVPLLELVKAVTVSSRYLATQQAEQRGNVLDPAKQRWHSLLHQHAVREDVSALLPFSTALPSSSKPVPEAGVRRSSSSSSGIGVLAAKSIGLD